MAISPYDVFRRELTIKGSFAQVNCFDRSLAMLRSGRVRTDGLITHRFALEQYGDAVMPREHEWDARWWSPIINAEHLRMREAAGVIDLSAFQILDITGPRVRPRSPRVAPIRSAATRTAPACTR